MRYALRLHRPLSTKRFGGLAVLAFHRALQVSTPQPSEDAVPCLNSMRRLGVRRHLHVRSLARETSGKRSRSSCRSPNKSHILSGRLRPSRTRLALGNAEMGHSLSQQPHVGCFLRKACAKLLSELLSVADFHFDAPLSPCSSHRAFSELCVSCPALGVFADSERCPSCAFSLPEPRATAGSEPSGPGVPCFIV